ncbi:MAG: bifunctional folylpolyglutamate synthase/dihydrofolate synthase [Candidatus Omnitrophica bacterium]|nr:bifunctional folylpolyglutamate synthase/dihydrofolate synthase [Candidatus Omnitrophota bacterium]
MTYPEAIQYLESFINYEKIPVYPYKESCKLERIKGFLETVGNPQDSLGCIHIAGTKGKGSTAAFIAYILAEAGYKTGLYTSPHLVDFRERIRILEGRPQDDFAGMILKEELAGLAEKMKPAIENYSRDSQHGELSFFEVYTALAYIYFKEKKADFVVLETGLGGRLDATNVVNSLVCVITPISYEHTQKLGSTLTEIATEKAGIIKDPCPLTVITAPQEDEVMRVIRNKCAETKARLCEVGKDITYQKTAQGFNIKGACAEYNDLKINLLGSHQLINASVSVASVEALRLCDVNVGIDAIRNGLYNTRWPGRCEIISRTPLVVLDGAQNVASSRALKEAVRENFRYQRLILVLGISKDKDIKGICDELYGLADVVILTKADNPRASEPENLAGYFNGKAVHITNNIKEARAKAYSLNKKEDLILACGSLFVVGEFRNV